MRPRSGRATTGENTMRALTRQIAIAATLMSVLTGTAFADTPWQQAHP
ncbi:hypothetical protein H3291_29705, partial [Escherichia coli]|nr:hypothetical protein [Escherichia coli]